MEQPLEIDKRPEARNTVSILPVAHVATNAAYIESRLRTKWLRAGREPAIVVTNEAGELIYTVHRAIHPDPLPPR